MKSAAKETLLCAAGLALCLAAIGAMAAAREPDRARRPWRSAAVRPPVRAALAEALVCPVGAPRHPWTEGSVVTSDHSEAALRRVAEAFARGGPVPVYAGSEDGAAGWCLALRADRTGLWARVRLSATAAKGAAEGRWLYLNPTFEEFVAGNAATGTPRRLLRLRLAAEPAL